MAKKLLVTRASGFIGTHCILESPNNGYHVIGIVRDLDRIKKILTFKKSY